MPIPRRVTPLRIAALTALIAIASSAPGHACAVCFDGGSRGTDAFTWSTIFLSLMPLIAVGSTVGWMLRALRRRRDPESSTDLSPT